MCIESQSLSNPPNLCEVVDQMPLTPTKRHRLRSYWKAQFERKRPVRGEALSSSSGGDSASFSDEEGASSQSSVSRYRSLVADRVRFVFDLGDGVDITDLADNPYSKVGDFSDLRRPAPPSGEVLEALTYPSFLKGEIGDALAEYEVYMYLCQQETPVRSYDALVGEFHPDDVVPPGRAAMYSVDDDLTYDEFAQDAEKLISTTTVDTDNVLDPEEIEEHELKRALYRIKAYLLLRGKAVDKLDNATLESKFPPSLIVKNYYFLNLDKPGSFGWYFDSKLCQVASLTDYQRLVIHNYGGYQYPDWSRYRSHYNSPETDREYLLYWKTITQKIKWVEDHMYLETSSLEWSDIQRKASYQAIRIATDFKNIHFDLACLGIEEFLWSTRIDVYNRKDLDGVFFEIWKRVIKEKNVKDCFAKALKEVYDLKMFPLRERSMRCEQEMARQFKLCTVGITAEVPEPKARQLIAQQVKQKLAMTWGYEHYASKKLKVAEYIGLIGKAST